jgi:hypothetical protein
MTDLARCRSEQARCRAELHALYCLCDDCYGAKQGIQDWLRWEVLLLLEAK